MSLRWRILILILLLTGCVSQPSCPQIIHDSIEAREKAQKELQVQEASKWMAQNRH